MTDNNNKKAIVTNGILSNINTLYNIKNPKYCRYLLYISMVIVYMKTIIYLQYSRQYNKIFI